MTVMTEPTSESFHFSMLLYDRRYRSITIQTVALIGVILALLWLGWNTKTNLELLGKDFDFSFLWARAGFDINQTPIPYTNDDTFGRAAMVGVVNTLIVAFFGCILATVIGVLVGVLRLSKNWLTSRLMTVYVESLRNVPVVIWIFLLFLSLTLATPAPNAFRGDTPTAHMWLDNTIAVTNRGTYIPLPLWDWQLAALIGVLVVSIIAAIFVSRRSVKRLEEQGIEPPPSWVIPLIAIGPAAAMLILGSGWMFTVGIILRVAALVGVYVGLQRACRMVAPGNDPLATIVPVIGLVAWFVWLGPMVWGAVFGGIGLDTSFHSFVPVSLPALKGFNFQGGFQLGNSFVALWLALSLYTGAFIAENVRAGIMAVSKGQTEAAYALGLRPGRTMNLVVLPQALRVIVPPLISQYLNLTKNTSLGIAASYMDLSKIVGGITLNQTGRALECVLLMMAIYLVISLLISAGMNLYNSSVKLKER